MFVIADGRFMNAEMIQQLARVSRVFARNHTHFFQHPQRAQRDVFEIAYRRGDEVKRHGKIKRQIAKGKRQKWEEESFAAPAK